MIIVLKFGGTSITKFGFNVIIEQINKYKNYQLIIVLSALSNITNYLVKYTDTLDDSYIAKIIDIHLAFLNKLELNENLLNWRFDHLKAICLKFCSQCSKINSLKAEIISYGEYLSTDIFYNYLQKELFTNMLLTDSSLYIKSDSNYSNLYIKGNYYCDSDIIKTYLKSHNIIITQGFVASTIDSQKCLLSRGGSDTTAAIMAFALNASRLEIWTDVNGIYNADPNIIKNAKIIEHLDYNLCQEMAAMGAKVLHPYCIKPCQEIDIPIIIKNTYGLNTINTRIGNTSSEHLSLILQENNIVFNISSLNMWCGYGFVSDIFCKFTKYNVDINIITTSQFEVFVTSSNYDQKWIGKLKSELSQKYKVITYHNCGLVSVIGKNIIQNAKIQDIFKFIENNQKYDILMTHFSSNNMCLSFVVPLNDSKPFYKDLYNSLF